jgi:hypothetical protein
MNVHREKVKKDSRNENHKTLTNMYLFNPFTGEFWMSKSEG